jgi:hypothetical protein
MAAMVTQTQTRLAAAVISPSTGMIKDNMIVRKGDDRHHVNLCETAFILAIQCVGIVHASSLTLFC